MIELYILNKDLEQIGIIDTYSSLIWAKRYNKVGDFELYLPATAQALTQLKIGYYLRRFDDDMIVRINKIVLETDAEDGNYLIVSGTDAKGILDQRIIWDTMYATGSVEAFCRKLVRFSAIYPNNAFRKILKSDNTTNLIKLGTEAGLEQGLTEQVSFANVGEKIRNYCSAFGYGYRFVLDAGQLAFEMYEGTDRSSSVIFSPQFDNLASSKYSVDLTNMGNAVRVGGEGEGAQRWLIGFGSAKGIDRYERFIDAKDLGRIVTWSELKDDFSGGSWSLYSQGVYLYRNAPGLIAIASDDHKTWLQAEKPSGSEVTVDGIRYWSCNFDVCKCGSNNPADDAECELSKFLYQNSLILRGIERMSKYGKKETFDGEIIPNVVFRYKTDYFLGDIVRVENEFGIASDARITEVIEVMDATGYSVQPRYEYKKEVE